ncbi:pilus assembly protein TadG-related protein [Knoellia sp. p5-6-4]|uniref:pilus assembly protein TadG-related protein n=1 Tax=unclassified Knoellia TaxID=2618719 RepID=UPI0023DC55B8|nr:pilus assembly protein TadG-related protein [Knoellia sp. p5-6-4]MDF2146345.1 pilus assembly protein TadG-related protein [Knoellia sp. p5-6-4]
MSPPSSRQPRATGAGHSPVARLRARLVRGGASRESGQVTLLILGFTLVAAMLVVGTVAVTSVQLSRMRLLDAADGAALDAADSLDARAYEGGLGDAVPVSDETVRATAEAYLAERPLPVGMLDWRVAAGTGSPDGRSAVVRLVGEADLPLVGGVLRGLGGSVTLTVESTARSDLQ